MNLSMLAFMHVLYIHVCVQCACMYVCVHVCVYVCMHACMNVHMQA